ncbi:MAG: hypothetical protein GY931_08815 [Maribacter sp.]|nr:hypothetical protein [Maribacter sp.]
MNLNEIIDLLERYGVISKENISKDELEDIIDEDMEPDEIAFAVLSELAEDCYLFYSLADGGWEDGNLIGSFYSNVERIVEMSKGKIELSDLVLSPPLNSKGEEDEDMDMTISFIQNGSKYEWCFSLDENDNFIEGFTKWAYQALEGNFLYTGDGPIGYHLPKGLIRELEELGIENEINSID